MHYLGIVGSFVNHCHWYSVYQHVGCKSCRNIYIFRAQLLTQVLHFRINSNVVDVWKNICTWEFTYAECEETPCVWCLWEVCVKQMSSCSHEDTHKWETLCVHCVLEGIKKARTHTHTQRGEKLYSCGTCGKSFTQWLMLVFHKPYHTGQRLYHNWPEVLCLQSLVTGFLTYAYPEKLGC